MEVAKRSGLDLPSPGWREKRKSMHRWFRFSTVIALVVFSHGLYAQELTAAAATPSKSRQKPSLLQGLQDQLEQQGKQIELQSKQAKESAELQSKAIEQQGKLIEEQSRQIGTLNEQLTQLVTLLKARESVRELPATAAPAAEPPHAAPPVDAPTPIVETSSTPSSEPAMAGIAPASSPAAQTHTVKRGENLTSIAHQHGTTVADLLKLNKIGDERKLQIGQTLLLPSPAPANSPKP